MKSEIFKNHEALHKAIYNCIRCKDSGYLVERVQPQWDPKKVHTSTDKWGMLIGQSPGITELERGGGAEKHETVDKSKDRCKHARIAFAGDAGCRLGEWLMEDAGFTEHQVRTQFYKTAVTKCFPGKDRRGGDRKPTKKEIQLCSPFLKEQIRLVNPSVLIPIGKVAINWFFPKVEKLEEVIGKKLQWTDGKQRYIVICLPHPSNASGWWKIEMNQPLLDQAKLILSKLREASFA